MVSSDEQDAHAAADARQTAEQARQVLADHGIELMDARKAGEQQIAEHPVSADEVIRRAIDDSMPCSEGEWPEQNLVNGSHAVMRYLKDAGIVLRAEGTPSPLPDLAALTRAEHWAFEAEKAFERITAHSDPLADRAALEVLQSLAQLAQAWAMVAIGWQGPEGPSDG